MYSVSDAYKIAIQENTRSFYWSGLIVTTEGKEYPFTNKDIVKGSGYVTRQCSGSSEIELGSVYAAEMGISLFSDIDRYSLENAKITLTFHMTLKDGTIEDVPMGVFFVAEANRKIRTLEIKAYDAMLEFEHAYNKAQSSGYPYDLLTLVCKDCKVDLAQTKAEIEALPNGTALLGVYPDNDIETCRDLLHYLSQALGCFAIIDRNGKLKLVQYNAAPVCTINNTHRYTSSFSDFVTRYTAINSTNKRTNTAEYYALNPDDGLTMNLGVNPLLQFGLDETRKQILTSLLNAISIINYVPFDSETIGDPALDLGDVLVFTGGQADATKMAAITSLTVRINGKCSLKCVGKNPRLAEAKSKNDKNINGLLNSVETTKMSTYSYVNALGYVLGAEKGQIIKLEYATQEETDCEFKATIILDVAAAQETKSITSQGTGTTILPVETKDAFGNVTTTNKELATSVSVPSSWQEDGQSVVIVTYVIDGHEIEEFHPTETWHSGLHLLNLFYPLLDMQEKTLHTFEVWISIAPGAGTIAAQCIIASIVGQGLGAQDRWDGRITAKDELSPILINVMSTLGLTGDVVTELDAPTSAGLSDQYSKIQLTGLPLAKLMDNLRVFAPVVHDVIDTSDKRKMSYSKIYVLDVDKFALRKAYEISGGTEKRLDRGNMDSLIISTKAFDSLTSITVNPFATAPFVGGHHTSTQKMTGTNYTVLVDQKLMLAATYKTVITSVETSIDKGRLVAYPLGLTNFATLTELEVNNG